MVEPFTRIKETREDEFAREDLQVGMPFQEFSTEVDRLKEEQYFSEGMAAFNALNEYDGPNQVEKRVPTTTDDLYSARRFHEDRSEVAQGRDQATNAERVTGEFEVWSENPSQFDFPGVDTQMDIGPSFNE